MDRIERLIEKLKEQYNAKAQPSLILATAQLLEAEIRGSMRETAVLGKSNISVLVPNSQMSDLKKMIEKPVRSAEEKEVFELVTDESLIDEDEEVTAGDYEIFAKDQNVEKQKESIKDIIDDIPTFFQQNKTDTQATLFERTNNSDQDTTRVRDLKKAIGLHDREVLIKELFRGDENMYERSIKTLNNFHIYAEAEYWIKRELKTKIGWPVDSDAVRFFDNIVKRRFA